MKKITTLFFLFTFMFLIFISNKNNDKTIFASSIKDNSYQKLYLKFEENDLTTKNFKIYFNSDMKIISLYPSFNINSCFLNDNRYLFKFKDLDFNLEGYINYYNDIFNNNTVNHFKGVPIMVVELDVSTNELNKILSKNKDIMYSQELCGNYQ